MSNNLVYLLFKVSDKGLSERGIYMEGELDLGGGDISISSAGKHLVCAETLVSSISKISCNSLKWMILLLFTSDY